MLKTHKLKAVYLLLLVLVMGTVSVSAQTLHRYKDENGDWQFSDRPPADQRKHTTERMSGKHTEATVHILQEDTSRGTMVSVKNDFHCPVEVIITLSRLKNIGRKFRRPVKAVVPARDTVELLEVTPAKIDRSYSYQVEIAYIPGDPTRQHDASHLYHMPYAKGTSFLVTQAFPDTISHGNAANRHAIDFAMPEGTPVYAARAGTVISTEYANYTGGTDQSDLSKANTVRIAHDDGTIGVYAHLSWNAIRVRTGQNVKRGQYIANSGNTGFSSGPHLHFEVRQNKGMKLRSVPVLFEGAGGSSVIPRSGEHMVNIE